MNIKKQAFLIFLSIAIVCNIVLLVNAQNQPENESVMRNSHVVDLVKSNLAETIIIAKIKNSKSSFDTSVDELSNLKDAGVSDNVILAMIESQKASPEDSESVEQEVVLGEIEDAVGKRRVFITSIDDESLIEIAKKFRSKGYTIVDNKSEAEILVELSYVESESQQKPGVFRSGSETKYISRIGKLTVKIIDDTKVVLVYSHEYPYARAANYTALLVGTSIAPPSLRDQVKYYLVDDFFKKLKKAGDRFK